MSEYEAGTELDALIAERVMGKVPDVDFGLRPHHEWEWDDHSEYNRMFCRWCWESSQEWVDPKTAQVDPEIDARPCYRAPLAYSTNIAQAWRVVEWMIAEGWLVTVEYRRGQWTCEVERIDRDESVVMVVGDTAPLAICRCVLKSIAFW